MFQIDSEVEQKILKAFRDFKEKKLDVLIIDGPADSGKSNLVNWLRKIWKSKK